MGKRMYEDLCEMLEGELNTLTKKGEITKESLELIDKLTHAIKSVTTIKAMEEAREWEKGGSYAQRPDYGRHSTRMYRDSSYDGNYSNTYYNDGDMSRDYSRDYSRDGRRGRDGDSDGRYSEDYRGYSRHDEKEAMMQKMRQMMNEAVDPKEKQMIQNYMQKMQSM